LSLTIDVFALIQRRQFFYVYFPYFKISHFKQRTPFPFFNWCKTGVNFTAFLFKKFSTSLFFEQIKSERISVSFSFPTGAALSDCRNLRMLKQVKSSLLFIPFSPSSSKTLLFPLDRQGILQIRFVQVLLRWRILQWHLRKSPPVLPHTR